MSMLELDDVHAYYGGIEALKGITLNVNKGEIVTLIGSNGAGKSTTLKSICGQVKTSGAIRFKGEHISSWQPHQVPPQALPMCRKAGGSSPN